MPVFILLFITRCQLDMAVECCLLNPMVQLHIHHLYSNSPACNYPCISLDTWILWESMSKLNLNNIHVRIMFKHLLYLVFFFSHHGLMFSSLSEVRFLFHSASSELWVNSTTAIFLCDGDKLEQHIQGLQMVTSSLSKDQILIIQTVFHFETPWKIVVFKE